MAPLHRIGLFVAVPNVAKEKRNKLRASVSPQLGECESGAKGEHFVGVKHIPDELFDIQSTNWV